MKRCLTTMALALGLLLTGAPLSRADESGPKQPGFKPYPLDVCLVGGEKLGSMGAPFAFKFEGREVKFCCKGCLDDFKKDHKKFMSKLDEADKHPKPSGSETDGHKHQEHQH